jgi:hypothetical protein
VTPSIPTFSLLVLRINSHLLIDWLSTHTRNIENGMKEVRTMLGEIYEWYIDNLKHTRAGPPPTAPPGSSQPILETEPRLTFEAYAEVPGGTEIGLICPRASFHPGWLTIRDHGSSSGLFRCHCRSSECFQKPTSRFLEGDHTPHLQFSREISPEKASITTNQRRRLILISAACNSHNSASWTSKLMAASCLFTYI